LFIDEICDGSYAVLVVQRGKGECGVQWKFHIFPVGGLAQQGSPLLDFAYYR
jgi:hypothetical protein